MLCLQQDITRGRDMVESLYQGAAGASAGGGTHNAIMTSAEYLSQVPANPASAMLCHQYIAS